MLRPFPKLVDKILSHLLEEVFFLLVGDVNESFESLDIDPE